MTDERPPEGAPAPAPAAEPPPPLAPYVAPAGPETHAPLSQQAAGAAGAYTPPPVPPPAVQQPAVAWAAPPVAVAATSGRTMLAAIAGVGLIVLGVLGGLIGLAIAVFGSSVVSQFDLTQYGDFGDINDPAAVISGAIAFVGIIVVAYSLVYLIGGIGIVRSRGWGRVMGLIVGILSGLFWLMSVTGGGGSTGGNIFFPLLMLVIHAYVVVVLIIFWRRKAA